MRIWFNKTFSTISSVLNQLKQADPRICLIVTHTHETASAFLAADEHYLEPAGLTGMAYLNWCMAFCRQHCIDTIWPAKEAVLFAQQQAVFQEQGIKVVSVAAPDVLRLLQNKAAFYQALSPSIAETMDFVAVNTPTAFAAAVNELSAKHKTLCVKPAVSVFGLGFRILDNHHVSIEHLLKGIEYHIPLNELQQGMAGKDHFDTLLVMEHLSGHEWSVDCVAEHGRLLCAVQRQKSLHAGHGQIIDNNDAIQQMVLRLTAYYRLNSIFNIQFKLGTNGPRLLEINPRPSGGFGMACLAGVNLAQLAWQALAGEPIATPTLRYGLKISEVKTPVVLIN